MKHLIKPKLIEEAKKNTVIIKSTQVDDSSLNCGIIISPKYVITAAHCLIGKTVVIKNGNKYTIADAVPIIPSCGVALLTLKEAVFPQPTLKIYRQIESGEEIFWTSLLFGEIQNAVFFGHIAASVTHSDGITYYYIHGGLCLGMSGSGVYNANGELVGMIMMTRRPLDADENLMMGLVVPTEYFMPLIALAREDLIIKPDSEKKPIETKPTEQS